MNPLPLSIKALEGFTRRYKREQERAKHRRLTRRIERLSPTFRFALERLYSDDGLQLIWDPRFKSNFGRKHDPLALKRITLSTARAMHRLGLVTFDAISDGGTFLWLTQSGRRRAALLEGMA